MYKQIVSWLFKFEKFLNLTFSLKIIYLKICEQLITYVTTCTCCTVQWYGSLNIKPLGARILLIFNKNPFFSSKRILLAQ